MVLTSQTDYAKDSEDVEAVRLAADHLAYVGQPMVSGQSLGGRLASFLALVNLRDTRIIERNGVMANYLNLNLPDFMLRCFIAVHFIHLSLLTVADIRLLTGCGFSIVLAIDLGPT